jgi:hypothetical protein
MRDVMLDAADREAEERGRWQAFEDAVEAEVKRIRGERDEVIEAVEDYDDIVDIHSPFRAWVVAVAQGSAELKAKAEDELECVIRDALIRQAKENIRQGSRDEGDFDE